MSDWHFWLGIVLVFVFVVLWLWSLTKTGIRPRRSWMSSRFGSPARWRNEVAASDLDPRAREIFEEDAYGETERRR